MVLANVIPRRWMWRFCREWSLQIFLLTCIIYLGFSWVAQTEFEAPVNLSRPKSLRRHEDYKWEDDDHLKIANNPTRRVPNIIHSSNEKLKEKPAGQQEPPVQQEPKEEPAEDFMTQQAAVQLERHSHLREACARHPELSQGGLNGFTLRHIYAHEKHKILYCFVPKVGCSNWKRVLMVLGGLRQGTEGITSDEAHFKNGMKRLSGLSPAEQQHRLKTYTKFMYTRQPFLRILSAYRNKFADIKVYRKESYFQMIAKRIMKRYRKDATPRELKTGENITWNEWTRYLTNPAERGNFDDHWQEIYKMCSPCKVNYDYLGRLETIGDDAKYMLTSLDLQDKVSYPAKANSHPTNSSKTYDTFFSQITKATLNKLWEVYKLDFELFGYPKPDF